MKNLSIATKRLLIQIAFFILQNPLLKNFATGKIYQGNLKMICTPGLNCYSCPAAVTSCPLGAMQSFFAGARQSISLFVTGFLLVIGLAFGRLICGYVCPMGLLQDLLYKIKTPKKKLRLRYPKYIKYVVLALFVIILPFGIRHELSGLGEPWFCKYICPSGMIFGALPLLVVNDFLRGMTGALFALKTVIAAGFIASSIFVYRFFCRVLCPFGAIYSLFNKIAFIKMRCDNEKCTNCGICEKTCQLMLKPAEKPNAPECVRCAKCLSTCPENALSYMKGNNKS